MKVDLALFLAGIIAIILRAKKDPEFDAREKLIEAEEIAKALYEELADSMTIDEKAEITIVLLALLGESIDD